MAASNTSEAAETYDQLLTHYEDIVHLEQIDNVLFWDQQVMMPADGTPARSGQRSTISSLKHDLLTSDELGGLLAQLADASLTDEEQAVVREIDRQYARETQVPGSLQRELSQAISDSTPVWQTARENDDFESFAPMLEHIVEIRQQQAAEIDPDAEPFDVIFAEYEPYLSVETVESMLHELRDELVPLIDAIRESDVDPAAGVFEGTYKSDAQFALSEEVLDLVGVDWKRTKLDTSTHPFSFGNQFDVRMTTRFDEAIPVDGLTSTLHEFGHTDYTQGLPDDAYGTPLGEPRSHGIHESQSRFWENQVGRTEAFWELIQPLLVKHFPDLEGTSARELYAAANQVYDENYIRVESDELTYHMHILLRFEIERDLINGDLAVADVPSRWNELMEELLGITPPSDTVGCLQDIHWSLGRIGTFQNYSVGSVFAAQLQAALESELGDIEMLIENESFDEIHAWLTDAVHQHGQRYTTDELIEVATGEPFTATYFISDMKEKYSDIYDL
ncbi:carboxypeptidase M32 [Natronocalculus amylovorans]|uniref:Metal-dependent carboxypeptidase n=1 Tax=Natronocalculus amylovorans TaxID=2917812 RepID=A0AAE3K9C4_9EURY|nr:carboxypeptidase M32 [Natronocalculus amylovorans]MCL9818217.1 carboxypeptidase M32 [Natronocalculus amylovorans]